MSRRSWIVGSSEVKADRGAAASLLGDDVKAVGNPSSRLLGLAWAAAMLRHVVRSRLSWAESKDAYDGRRGSRKDGKKDVYGSEHPLPVNVYKQTGGVVVFK